MDFLFPGAMVYSVCSDLVFDQSNKVGCPKFATTGTMIPTTEEDDDSTPIIKSGDGGLSCHRPALTVGHQLSVSCWCVGIWRCHCCGKVLLIFPLSKGRNIMLSPGEGSSRNPVN